MHHDATAEATEHCNKVQQQQEMLMHASKCSSRKPLCMHWGAAPEDMDTSPKCSSRPDGLHMQHLICPASCAAQRPGCCSASAPPVNVSPLWLPACAMCFEVAFICFEWDLLFDLACFDMCSNLFANEIVAASSSAMSGLQHATSRRRSAHCHVHNEQCLPTVLSRDRHQVIKLPKRWSSHSCEHKLCLYLHGDYSVSCMVTKMYLHGDCMVTTW